MSPHVSDLRAVRLRQFRGSLGIVIGGLGAMVPVRRQEIVALGLRTILSDTLAACMSGAMAGALAG